MLFLKFSLAILSWVIAATLWVWGVWQPWSLLIAFVGIGMAGYEVVKMAKSEEYDGYETTPFDNNPK